MQSIDSDCLSLIFFYLPGKINNSILSQVCKRWCKILSQRPVEEDTFDKRAVKYLEVNKRFSCSLGVITIEDYHKYIFSLYNNIEMFPDITVSLNERNGESFFFKENNVDEIKQRSKILCDELADDAELFNKEACGYSRDVVPFCAFFKTKIPLHYSNINAVISLYSQTGINVIDYDNTEMWNLAVELIITDSENERPYEFYKQFNDLILDRYIREWKDPNGRMSYKEVAPLFSDSLKKISNGDNYHLHSYKIENYLLVPCN